MEDGTEQPIGFVSRTLAPAERKYAQVEKEALAIIFGVKKFHQYFLERRFTILSDHKPLMYLLSEVKGVPSLASARIQHWALTLSAYEYAIWYRPGKDLANADALSRLPLAKAPQAVPVPAGTVLLFERLETPWSRRPRFGCGQDETQCLPRFDDTYYMAGHNQWTTQTVG